MTSATIDKTVSWTWADQISSWRFWGLVLFYLLTISLSGSALAMGCSIMRSTIGMSAAAYGTLVSAQMIAAGFGFCLAWVVIKGRPVASLVFLSILKICGLILLFHGSAPLWARLIGAVLTGLSTGAISLAIPAIFAGGRNGAEAFLVSFGALSTFGILAGFVTNFAMRICADGPTMGSLKYIVIIPAILSVPVLLSVRNELFTGEPPERGSSLTPSAREPLAVAFLFFVPIYWLYWLYRAHGEVARVAPSRTLLSPRGAVLCSIFIPFLYSIAMSSLIEAMNRRCLELGRPRLRSPVTIFLWALFFPPVAGAMIQSGINGFIPEQPAEQVPLQA